MPSDPLPDWVLTRRRAIGDHVRAVRAAQKLSQEKLGQTPASRKTLQDLVRRYPQSGEAQLARERLGTPPRR